MSAECSIGWDKSISIKNYVVVTSYVYPDHASGKVLVDDDGPSNPEHKRHLLTVMYSDHGRMCMSQLDVR